MSAPILLPCPFCGSAPALEREDPPKSSWRWSVQCENARCPAEPLVIGSTEAVAVGRWNWRAHTPSDVLSSLQVGE